MAQNKKQIINLSDARNAAHNFTEAQVKAKEEKQGAFEILLAEVEKINPAMRLYE